MLDSCLGVVPLTRRALCAGVLAVAILFAAVACSGGGERAADTTEASPAIPAPPDVAAAPADASVTASGIASKVISGGSGTRHPRPNSRVRVHYTGWTVDGKMFDSSVSRNEPIAFGLDEVIPGWTQGVQMMVEGEKRRFWIPAALAYQGVPDRPQGTLVFDIELIRIES